MSEKTFYRVGLVLLILVVFAVPSLRAEMAAVEFSAPGWTYNGDYTMGYEFKPTVDILVTHLGVYDHLGDGLTQEHKVAIWRDFNQSLVTPIATVSGSDPLAGHFRYQALGTPVQLNAGSSYVVGAEMWFGLGGDPYMAASSGFASAAEIPNRMFSKSSTWLQKAPWRALPPLLLPLPPPLLTTPPCAE